LPIKTKFAATLELCDNSDLRSVLLEHSYLDEATINFLFKQIFEGVSYLHLNGIAH